jgi:hypothetical protein
MALARVGTLGASQASPGMAQVCAEMAQATSAFWKSLSPEQQAKARFEFADAERQNWHFIPRERKGLPLKEMNPDQRKLALALLATGVSKSGYEKATTIMTLESILAEMEGPNRKFPRDPELYFFSVFGTPDPKGTWGWRMEGHHVSLNYTIVAGALVAGTPCFLGTNPAWVKEGPRKGLRVLGNDEELGRTLVKSLSDEQKALAILSKEAPGDILLEPGRVAKSGAKPLDPPGLSYAKLGPDQQHQLWKLVEEYARRLRGELAERDLARIEKAGREQVTFAWAGGLELGEGHYYRVQGPTFVLEYDNTQNKANHVHSIWHDPASNFGADMLKEHYRAEHPK